MWQPCGESGGGGIPAELMASSYRHGKVSAGETFTRPTLAQDGMSGFVRISLVLLWLVWYCYGWGGLVMVGLVWL